MPHSALVQKPLLQFIQRPQGSKMWIFPPHLNSSKGSLEVQQSPLLSSSHLDQQFTSPSTSVFWWYCCFWYISTFLQKLKSLCCGADLDHLHSQQNCSEAVHSVLICPGSALKYTALECLGRAYRQDYELSIDMFVTSVILCSCSLLSSSPWTAALKPDFRAETKAVLNTTLLQN